MKAIKVHNYIKGEGAKTYISLQRTQLKPPGLVKDHTFPDFFEYVPSVKQVKQATEMNLHTNTPK